MFAVFLLTLVPDFDQKVVSSDVITGINGTEGALTTGSTQQVRILRLRGGTGERERGRERRVFFPGHLP